MTNRTELEDRAMEWIQTMLNSDMEPEFKEIIEDVETEDVSDVEGVYALARHLAFYNEARPVPPQAAGFVLWAFRLAIQEENGEAMLNLGVLYYTGRLGEQDFAKAVKYYKMAYAHGEWFACQNLGYCYYYGRSVEVDYARAYHYFVKTALKGFTESLYKLGDMSPKACMWNRTGSWPIRCISGHMTRWTRPAMSLPMFACAWPMRIMTALEQNGIGAWRCGITRWQRAAFMTRLPPGISLRKKSFVA